MNKKKLLLCGSSILFGCILIIVSTPIVNNIVVGSSSARLTYPHSSFKEFHEGCQKDLCVEKMQFDVLLKEKSVQSTLISTSGGTAGMDFYYSQSIYATLFEKKNSPSVYQVPLIDNPTLNTWYSISCTIQNNQTVILTVNSKIINKFTFNESVLNSIPEALFINNSSIVNVKNIIIEQINETKSGWVKIFSMRSMQFVGFLLTALGVFSFLSYLSKKREFDIGVSDDNVSRIIFGIVLAGAVVNGLVFCFLRTKTNQQLSLFWLFDPHYRFSDFFQVKNLMSSFEPFSATSMGNYPPLGYLILLPITWMTDFSSLIALGALVVGFSTWWILKVMGFGTSVATRIIIALGFYFSLPVSFAFDRGNIDLIIFCFFCFIFLTKEIKGDFKQISSIALLAAAKIFPIIFVIPMLKSNLRKKFFYLIGLISLLTLPTFLLFNGKFFSNLSNFVNALTTSPYIVSATYYNASIYGFLQGLGFMLNGISGATSIQNFISGFPLIFQLLLLVQLVIYVLDNQLETWEELTIISLFIVLFSYVSAPYELLFIFPGIMLFLKKGDFNKRDKVTAVLYALVIMPKAYFAIFANIDSGVLFQAPSELALLANVVLTINFRKKIKVG